VRHATYSRLSRSHRGLLSVYRILENRVSSVRTSLEREDLSPCIDPLARSGHVYHVVILVLRDRRVSERHRDALTRSRAENIHEEARRREKTREREREREEKGMGEEAARSSWQRKKKELRSLTRIGLTRSVFNNAGSRANWATICILHRNASYPPATRLSIRSVCADLRPRVAKAASDSSDSLVDGFSHLR